MKRFFAPLLVALLGLSGPAVRVAVPAAAVAVAAYSAPAQAYELYLGTLTSTGASVNQGTTASPFTIPTGVPLAVSCIDGAACLNVGSGSSTAASCAAGSAGVPLQQGQLYDIPMVWTADHATLAVDTVAIISVSGTVNCKVFRVVTP